MKPETKQYHAEFFAATSVLSSLSAADLCREFGSPLYVYNTDILRERVQGLRALLDQHQCQHIRIHYAVKANHNLAMLQTIVASGAGADIVSLGEWNRLRRVGMEARSIIFSGVGKDRESLRAVLEDGIGQINIESLAEADTIFSLIKAHAYREPRLLLRFTPDVGGAPHPYIATAHQESKFGLLRDEVLSFFASRPDKHSAIQGLALHIGSQITDLAAYRHAFTQLHELLKELKETYSWQPRCCDLGGGMGIAYRAGDQALDMAAYCALLHETSQKIGASIPLMIEPGRYLAGSCGVLLSRVIRTKQSGDHRYLIIDAAMNDLLRPALYHGNHPIVCANANQDASWQDYHVVGPICESADVFQRNTALPSPKEGDTVIIGVCGAYAAVMASNYNARGVCPEVVIKNAQENAQAHLSTPALSDEMLLEREMRTLASIGN